MCWELFHLLFGRAHLLNSIVHVSWRGNKCLHVNIRSIHLSIALSLSLYLSSVCLSVCLSVCQSIIQSVPIIIPSFSLSSIYAFPKLFTFTFTFMHLADAFIQSDLHCIQVTVSTFYELFIYSIQFFLNLLINCSVIMTFFPSLYI